MHKKVSPNRRQEVNALTRTAEIKTKICTESKKLKEKQTKNRSIVVGNIKKYCTVAGIKPYELAATVGICESSWRNKMSGRTEFALNELTAIAYKLGGSVESLFVA